MPTTWCCSATCWRCANAAWRICSSSPARCSRRWARSTAGRRVTVVPGNHDHGLAAPWLDRLRLDGRSSAPRACGRCEPGDGPLGRIAAAYMPRHALSRVAYPGLRLRPDVYATHGHYLDMPLTVPRIESVAASIDGARSAAAGRRPTGAADYEAALAPLYGLLGGFAESGRRRHRCAGAAHLSPQRLATVPTAAAGWRASPLGRLAIPGAVFLLNRLGAGPLEASDQRRAPAPRRARRHAPVAGVLAPDAEPT